MPIWPFGHRKPTAPPHPPTRVAGVVPCAGSSERMGTSKALLDAGGRSFLAAVVGTLVAGGCDPVLVVLAEGQNEEDRKAKAAGALTLVNPDPGEGPITSLRLALGALSDSVAAVAFLPVDHPRVRPETTQHLVRAFLDADVPLVLPVYEGKRGHPAVFGRALFGALADPELDGGARRVVHAHLEDALLIEVDDPGVVQDIDTPEAYRAAFS